MTYTFRIFVAPIKKKKKNQTRISRDEPLISKHIRVNIQWSES